jgi:3-mercaptopyruvate sulfurtransferase SseA
MVLLVDLLNHRRIGLRWGIEVIGAADVVMVHGGLNRWIARQR